ncbi:MAG: response regulator [Lachnospiraceae bacterium]
MSMNKDILYQSRVALIFATLLFIAGLILLGIVLIMKQKKIRELKQKTEELAREVEKSRQVNREKNLFLTRMSHEIRTPMNAVVGITAIAKTQIDDKKKIRECLNKISVSSKALLSVINDVLDMSAIENEKLKLNHLPFDIRELLSTISTMYYFQCKQKGLQFDMFSDDVTEELLIGDSLRLNQILLSLVSRSYNDTPAGGKISVIVKQMDKKDTVVFLRFIVADTGSCFTEEQREELMHPHWEDGCQQSEQTEGSGLAFSIAMNLINLMHGAIRFQSEEGEGTTITIDIPFEINDMAQTLNSTKFRNVRALVVDDDENTRDYTAIVLNRIGVKFDMVESGEEAVELLTRASKVGRGYDVCFVDWKMPGMNGVDVTKKIRELFDEDTVIIIVSAYDLSEVEDEARQAGANMFVAKPLFQSTVFDVLMTLSGGEFVKNTAEISDYDFTGKRVLLAEDNVLNAEIAVELLKLVNMEVTVAENGKEALDLFEQSEEKTFDAILMDIQMPVMDGHEATRKIREGNHKRAKTIPIFAMTANAFAEDITAAFSVGMNGHIEKPIDTEILYGTLAKAIE